MRPLSIFLAAIAVVAISAGSAAAQSTPSSWTREVSAGVGLGHVFRFDDRTFGNRPNVSAGVRLTHRTRLGVDVELNRTLGLSPSPAPCAIVINNVPAVCVGSAHDGVTSATIASVGVRYQFTAGKVRPYVTAGVGMLRSTSVWSTARVSGDRVILTEDAMSETGFGPDLGAGLRIPLGSHMSISPEVRWLEASWRSPLNLAVTRATVKWAYSW